MIFITIIFKAAIIKKSDRRLFLRLFTLAPFETSEDIGQCCSVERDHLGPLDHVEPLLAGDCGHRLGKGWLLLGRDKEGAELPGERKEGAGLWGALQTRGPRGDTAS